MESRRRSPSFVGRCYQAANPDAAARPPPEALSFKPPLLACCHPQRPRAHGHRCGIRPIRACFSVRVAHWASTRELQPSPAVSVAKDPALRL